MKSTDRYGFPYPEDNDFGDGSTQLAALATAIDDELQARINGFNAVLTPPTYIRGRSTTVNYTNSSTFQSITWNTDVYSSDGLNGTVIDTIIVPTPGIYQAGMFLHLATVGAVNLNTSRIFKLEYTDRLGSSLDDTVVMDWQQSTLEAATGVAATLHAVFPVYTPLVNFGGLRAYLKHDNVASQMQVQITSFIWIHRLGDLVV